MIWALMMTETIISGEGGWTMSASVFDTITNLWSDAFLAGRGGDFDHRLVESEVKAEAEVKAEEEEEEEEADLENSESYVGSLLYSV